CASTYDRKTAFMRVRWPSPCLLNHSNTSLSTRRCTEVLALGITTRARFQKPSPTAGASGALTRVLLAPRAAFLLIALREYLTVVFFCVMTVCFPCADDTQTCTRYKDSGRACHRNFSSQSASERHHRRHRYAMRESFPDRGSKPCARLQGRRKRFREHTSIRSLKTRS